MPAGKIVRQDNLTAEKMTARASSGDQDMFNAMIQDVLPSGAVPDVAAANEAGAKKLLQPEQLPKRRPSQGLQSLGKAWQSIRRLFLSQGPKM